MSMNINVTSAAQKMGEAHSLGHASKEYRKAREEYFAVLKEEIRKDGDDAWGWLDWEDPSDVLYEEIEIGASKNDVYEVLNDYIRFHEVLENFYGYKTADEELIAEAKDYINR